MNASFTCDTRQKAFMPAGTTTADGMGLNSHSQRLNLKVRIKQQANHYHHFG
jgi:hypothetical protein